ncbi:MAG: 50S ribosomal protein L18 [Pseudomonadota bacterium]
MGNQAKKIESRLRRKKRVRKKVAGTVERPRLTVFRSARHIYAQVVVDTTGLTLAAASSVEKEVREKLAELGKKADVAKFVGKLVADRARAKGVEKVVFDRNGFLYHGRVKAVSTGAREAGLQF